MALQTLPHRIHLVGIGGIGLSAIARVLSGRGHRVTGSDMHRSSITAELEASGIVVNIGHNAVNIADAEMVLISSAIPEGNPEIVAARSRGVPVLKRQQMLGALLEGKQGLAVAGTHGKTTTSSMLAVVWEQLGLAPSFIVGGVIQDLGTNARAGSGPHFVIEADEYDRAFHGLQPDIAIITNLEMDHPDCYADIAAMREAYQVFCRGVSADGSIIACADSSELMRALGDEEPKALIITYGLDSRADFVVHDVTLTAQGGMRFVIDHAGRPWIDCELALAGVHNALNATACLIAASRCGLDLAAATQALGGFSGAQRRFERKGEARGIIVIDDYAHHPTEIAATLAAARSRWGDRRLWAVFQPHTYSRTKALFNEFTTCFDDADQVVVTDIFAARAKEHPTTSGLALANAIHHPAVCHMSDFQQIVDYLAAQMRAGDVLLTLGAGDGYLIGERLLEALT